MARQQLLGGWTLDVPSGYTRRVTEDGFVVVEQAERAIWATAYVTDDGDREDSLREMLEWYGWQQDGSYEELDRNVIAYIRDAPQPRRKGLCTIVAFCAVSDSVARIEIDFNSEKDRPNMEAIMHSPRYTL